VDLQQAIGAPIAFAIDFAIDLSEAIGTSHEVSTCCIEMEL